MPWKWLAASLATVCVAVGSTAVFSQQPRCDSTSTPCGACACGQCREGVGVRIPSLQVLFVDKLSAVGDRLERSCRTTSTACDPSPRIPRTKHGIRKLQDKLSAPSCAAKTTCAAEPSCGVEPSCGLDTVSVASLPPIVRRTRSGASASRPGSSCADGRCPLPADSGKITDSSPPPRTEMKQTVNVLVPPESSLPVSVPVSIPNSEPPKLLPTPLSDLQQVPVVPKVEPPQSPVPPVAPTEESEPLPRVESAPPAPLKQEALPDILVDPFLEDVSKARTVAPKGVALSGWRSSAPAIEPKSRDATPFNSLREASTGSDVDMPRIQVNEPKRLTLGQKQATAVHAPPRAKRIVVMQSLADQGGQ